MKRGFYIIIILLFTIIVAFASYAQTIPDDSQYLGQIPPGNTPKIFPVSVTSGYFAAERIAISKDKKNIYYNELNGYNSDSKSRIKYYSYSNRWTGPFNLLMTRDFCSFIITTMITQRIIYVG